MRSSQLLLLIADLTKRYGHAYFEEIRKLYSDQNLEYSLAALEKDGYVVRLIGVEHFNYVLTSKGEESILGDKLSDIRYKTSLTWTIIAAISSFAAALLATIGLLFSLGVLRS